MRQHGDILILTLKSFFCFFLQVLLYPLDPFYCVSSLMAYRLTNQRQTEWFIRYFNYSFQFGVQYMSKIVETRIRYPLRYSCDTSCCPAGSPQLHILALIGNDQDNLVHRHWSIRQDCVERWLCICRQTMSKHLGGETWIWHDDVIKWKPFPHYWPFVRRIHRSPVNSTHKGQWCGALMFSLICVWINDWVYNRVAGHLRRYRAHYDVIVMEADHYVDTEIV